MPTIDWTIQSVLFDGADGAVEGDPCHDLRVDEVPAWPADLPDAGVGLLPDPLQVPQEHALQAPRLVLVLERLGASLVERVHHLPVDVELKLLARCVADADRPRVLVAGEPRKLELGKPALAGDAVH